jgi:HSP20 family protein
MKGGNTMSLVRWNPAHELAMFPSDVLSIQREINRMFNSFFRPDQEDESLATSSWNPAVDIAEHEDQYIVKVELPGVSREDVKVTMEENQLMIRGEKKQEKESKGSNYHRLERSYGSFQRTFALPSNVKGERIEASFKDGVLNIVLPKAEEAKRKEIEVKVK